MAVMEQIKGSYICHEEEERGFLPLLTALNPSFKVTIANSLPIEGLPYNFRSQTINCIISFNTHILFTLGCSYWVQSVY